MLNVEFCDDASKPVGHIFPRGSNWSYSASPFLLLFPNTLNSKLRIPEGNQFSCVFIS